MFSGKFAITNQRNWELVSGRCAFKFTDFYWSWTPFWRHFGVLGHHFGTTLVIIGCKNLSGGSSNAPTLIFINFWWFLGGLLGSLWGHFSIIYVIWGIKKHVWIAGTILDDFWLEKLLISDVPTSKNIVKTIVFTRFHFFDFLLILMVSGTSWDLNLEVFGGLEALF